MSAAGDQLCGVAQLLGSRSQVSRLRSDGAAVCPVCKYSQCVSG